VQERAGYLPGLNDDDVSWHTLEFDRHGSDAVHVTVPKLTPQQLRHVISTVKAARRRFLVPLSVAEIIDIIDAAVSILLDRNGEYRQRAETLLPRVSGFDVDMVRLALGEYLKTFRKPELLRFVHEDFANPGVLDGLQPAVKGGLIQAHGPQLLTHIWAGNVPALSLWSFVCGLLVKGGNVGKVASAEPLFAGWFAELIAEVEPKLANAFAVVWWPSEEHDVADALFAESDVVLAYGANDSLAAIGARVPITTRYLPYGHKLSFAMVGAEALDQDKSWTLAHAVAVDIMRYDQHGCYSPQVVFVETGGRSSAREFARMIGHELQSLELKFPRRSLTMTEAQSVAGWRNRAEMHALADELSEVITSPTGAWSVAYSEGPLAFAPSGLNRTVRIQAVTSLEDVAECVSPFKTLLQTVGLAASPERTLHLSAQLGAVGVTRICAVGAMTEPEAGWHHDGRFNLLDLVTMSEVEASTLRASEAFADYAE
jgi:hypothetical protein